jgi:hypothetical protein
VDARVGSGDRVLADLEGVFGGGTADAADNWFRQEYMCEFVQDFEGLFDMDLVDAAFEDR